MHLCCTPLAVDVVREEVKSPLQPASSVARSLTEIASRMRMALLVLLHMHPC
jgi:hypothetical protein